ncbi:alpha/beta fold hydrolase [Streptomyces sp. AC495_CC817]|uniref:alpha/beta fold hydrolase n=1 Tax=Streptomyces sp. AC495_CC817 TaxID=2823900 RepID=UPI001C260B3C|nr:alpha/beta fold hydrolase [Streptomyces sp. AC495_CC817]
MSEISEAVPDRFVTLPSGIRICYRDAGKEADPVIVLIPGMGEDLTYWTDSAVDALVERGFRVISIDNRDSGRSSRAGTPPPAIWRQVIARPRPDGYTLADMAADTVGVLDHLGIERAHLVGRSMGGMIAQTIAATEPNRVLTLTSLYSTTGARKVGQPAWSTMKILAGPEALNRTDAVRAHLRITRHIAGTGYPIDDAAEAALAAHGWDRSAGDIAAGAARQIQAIQLSGDRTEQLRRITAPTLIINGDRDLLVAPSGGVATAQAIRSSQHIIIPGMGHHMTEALVAPIIDHIVRHVERQRQGGAHVEHA